MTTIDLSSLTRRQLEALRRRIAKTLARVRERDRQAAIKAAEATTRAYGFSLGEVLPAPQRRRTKVYVPPKYQHPEDPMRTWSGRGRPPTWVREMLEDGKALEDIKIR